MNTLITQNSVSALFKTMKAYSILLLGFLSFSLSCSLSGEPVGAFALALEKTEIVAVVSKTGKTTFFKGHAKIKGANHMHWNKYISDQGKKMGGAIVIISQRPVKLTSIKIKKRISMFNGEVEGDFDEFCRDFGFKSVGLEVGPKIEPLSKE